MAIARPRSAGTPFLDSLPLRSPTPDPAGPANEAGAPSTHVSLTSKSTEVHPEALLGFHLKVHSPESPSQRIPRNRPVLSRVCPLRPLSASSPCLLQSRAPGVTRLFEANRHSRLFGIRGYSAFEKAIAHSALFAGDAVAVTVEFAAVSRIGAAQRGLACGSNRRAVLVIRGGAGGRVGLRG